ncbi:MAG: type II secretion system F family protein [bacterium]|nr:type II secretion system F family protein [bacterium]
MARYYYVARDTKGNRIEGLLEAPSNIAVVTRLRNQNLFPVNIQIAEEKGLLLSKQKQQKLKKGRVNLKELALFTRQASTMLAAGVSITDTLDDLSTQTSNKYFSNVLQNIKSNIQEGDSFSSALSKHPKVFSPLYIALIKSGEESGNTAEVMKEIASDFEEQLILKSKVKQALSYPIVVLIFFIAVVFFVFLFLLPKFNEIFKSFNAQLPKFTLVILGISEFFISALPFILPFFFICFISFFIFNRTPAGREKIDRMKLRTPIFGPLILKVSLSRFSNSLATLLAGGVPIVSALDIVSKTVENKIVENAVLKVRKGVLQGALMGEEMKKYKIFPILLTRMVMVGEETGNIEEMLRRTAKFFKDEVDATLNVLTSILEPILIIGLAVIVGTIVIAIYLPIFNLAGSMR